MLAAPWFFPGPLSGHRAFHAVREHVKGYEVRGGSDRGQD